MTLLGRALASFLPALSHTGLTSRLGASATSKAAELDRLQMVQSSVSTGLGVFASTNAEALLRTYGGVGWMFAVVSRIVEGVAAPKWRLYTQPASGERKEIEEHPLLDLWNSVNMFFTQQEFIETFQQHLDLVGESYWLLLRPSNNKVAPPIELWPLRPDRIRPVPSEQKYIAGYIYRVAGEDVPLEPRDVIFLRRPNPLDPYHGLGPVQAILADLDSERYSAQWNRNFFWNSAEPGGIIQVDQTLSDADFQRMLLRWREQHQGVSNAHRVAILERAKWVERRYTMRDMQFEALRRTNRDIILGAYGMPRHLLGITDDVNRATAEAAEVIFSRWLLIPRLERIKASINERLAPLFGPGLEMDYDDPTPENRELNLREASDGYRFGVLTRNEARRLLGQDEVDGGDDFTDAPAPAGRMAYYGDGLTKAVEDTPLERLEAKMLAQWERRLRRERDGIIEYIEAQQ